MRRVTSDSKALHPKIFIRPPSKNQQSNRLSLPPSTLTSLPDLQWEGALGPQILGQSSSIKGGVSDKPEGEFPRQTKCPGYDWGDSVAFCLAGIGPFQDVILSVLITHSTAEGMRQRHRD
ncbi:hypothetical protein CDAR_97131 [Caerostris darwini]|uniref:Uncharacterized protein n=1 Tax=Caerostris darwini TaxID=1538125 RepID=A0AAV4QPD2_9ARAC|nr:hypothetical protein CDAR_97131 [Caerostris darwini]